MKSAPITRDEAERLAALYDYNVLDTEAENVFDDLATLASEICETPIALISLVDPDRQWFKAKVGIDAAETHRDIAFCAHAIHDRQVFEINDTFNDERFFDNPLVTGAPNIRFYAGAQLVTPEGHAIGTLCAISDEPKQLSEHQRKALQILSREVISQLELRKRNRQLKNESLRVTEFLSNISHELRTPLNAIISFTDLLKQDIAVQNPTKRTQTHLSHLAFSGERMLDIVNSVLDLSKIEAGKMDVNLAPVESRTFFEKLHGMMRIKADEKGLTFDCLLADELPLYLCIDEPKLSQILINLCSNAIKFTPKGKRIRLRVHVIDDGLKLMVEDEGIGIGSDELPKLFNKFHQVKKHGGQEGTGLGLAITKGLVELLDGTITVASQENRGTRVFVALPLKADCLQGPEQLAEVRSEFSGVQALIVEDNEINRIVAQEVMASLGIDAKVVNDGESAVEVCQQDTFDVVFMDINLPGISGTEAAKQIKGRAPLLPIIALTADVFESDNNNTNSALDGYLTKPIEKRLLCESLDKLFPLKP